MFRRPTVGEVAAFGCGGDWIREDEERVRLDTADDPPLVVRVSVGRDAKLLFRA